MVLVRLSGHALPKHWPQWGDCRILFEAGKAKWKSRLMWRFDDMADVPWNSSVLNTGQLTVEASGIHGNWSAAITAAIRDLNTLLKSNNVNVSLVTGTSANVTIATTTGAYTFPVNGVNQSGTLRTDIVHGATRSIDYKTGIGTSRDHAYTFLPLHPRINPQDRTSRDSGEPVLRVIVGHEFLHALGLDLHDPSFNGIFAGTLTLNEGGTPAQDTVSPWGTTTKLPPLVLSGDTVTRLRALWP
jgi:hypothetical protein